MAILQSTIVNGQLEADSLYVQAAANQTALNVVGNAKITGNLEVDGDLVYVGATDIRVEDKIIEIGYLNSGNVTPSQANGAGIVIGNQTSPVASILYKYVNGGANDRVVVNKKIEGTIENADTASVAGKTVGKLTFGNGIVASTGTSFDGSSDVQISVGSGMHVNRATLADTASKVANALTISGTGMTSVTYDGSAAKSVNIDLSSYLPKATFDAFTGSNSTAISTAVANAINGLDATISNTAAGSGTTASSQIKTTVTETNGKISAVTVQAPAFDLSGSAAAAEAAAKSHANTAVSTVSASLAAHITSATTTNNTFMKKDGSNSNITSPMSFNSGAAQIKYNSTSEAFEFIFA